jgi:hypothetical protein
LGKATVIYAKPNTGKTLITLSMISRAIREGRLDPSKLFYLNMDDDSSGLTEKAKFAEEYGFHMLADGHQGFEAKLFRETMEEMIRDNTAQGVIVILDTLKKFTDPMDKGKSSNFSRLTRQFIFKGGTVIALAHTNKHDDADGNPIYGGTSDIVDDFDCAYTMKKLSDQDDKKVIKFLNIKRRGNVARSVSYSYSTERGISYNELLLSVEMVDEMALIPLKQAAETKSDAEVIAAIETCIKEGINTKMKLAAESAERAGISKRRALKVIEKYTGDDPACHHWSFEVRAHNAKVYVLLDRSSGQTTAQASDS